MILYAHILIFWGNFFHDSFFLSTVFTSRIDFFSVTAMKKKVFFFLAFLWNEENFSSPKPFSILCNNVQLNVHCVTRGANTFVWGKVDCQAVISLKGRIFFWFIWFTHQISAIKEAYPSHTCWLTDDMLMDFFDFYQLPDPAMSTLGCKWH